MTGIIDYNAGNIKSVERSLAYIKAPYILSKNPKELQSVDRIIFPGDGEAAYAMEQLKEQFYKRLGSGRQTASGNLHRSTDCV